MKAAAQLLTLSGVALLFLTASASECPAPVSSLYRRSDLSICDAGERPPDIPSVKQAAQPEAARLPSFEEWRQRHADFAVAVGSRGERGEHSSVGHERGESWEAPETLAGGGQAAPEGSSPVTAAIAEVAAAAAEDAERDAALARLNTSLATTSYIHPLSSAQGSDLVEDPLLPLRSRTNYASQDCAASVLMSSKASKHAGSILSSAKDRYMLTPCLADPKFVVVELCDEIAIDTLVLANLEFFSSMFKLFRVTVSEVYPGREGDWRELGVFRAGNLRGSQVFKPPRKAGFYRYMRVDFLTHYGTEHYCPVSLLQVYGRTQMDSYRDEERAREEALRHASAILLAQTERTTADDAAKTVSSSSDARAMPSEPIMDKAPSQRVSVAPTKPSASDRKATTSDSGILGSASGVATPEPAAFSKPERSQASGRAASLAPTEATSEAVASHPSGAAASTVRPPPALKAAGNHSATDNATAVTTSVPLPGEARDATSNTSRAITNETKTSSHAAGAPSPSQATANGVPWGESIYGTIMKRLNILETNVSLGLRYADEQRRFVGASISKLEKQLVAAEALRKQDSQLIRRLILDFDLHRARLEEERQAMSVQLTMLANEIVFERRLGLAQLLALLVVLFFVAVTRGSASTALMPLATPRIRPIAGLVRRRSMDRPRRAHTSLPATSGLPRAPQSRRSLLISAAPRPPRRSRSLTPPPSRRLPPPRPLPSPPSDRWATSTSSGSDDSDPPRAGRQPLVTTDGNQGVAKRSASLSSDALLTPTVGHALENVLDEAG